MIISQHFSSIFSPDLPLTFSLVLTIFLYLHWISICLSLIFSLNPYVLCIIYAFVVLSPWFNILYGIIRFYLRNNPSLIVKYLLNLYWLDQRINSLISTNLQKELYNETNLVDTISFLMHFEIYSKISRTTTIYLSISNLSHVQILPILSIRPSHELSKKTYSVSQSFLNNFFQFQLFN